MDQTTAIRPVTTPGSYEHTEAHSSGVSWSAVIAGAVVTAALALILLALGTGLGLSSVSPWSNVGASASTIGKASIIWLIVLEILSSSMGGYLAGRLRTKWTTIHNDEVYFRDTAHGFLAWSVALVITAAFLAAAATSMVGSSATAANASKSSSSAEPSNDTSSNAYFVDTLFRTDPARPDSANRAVRDESEIIFAKSLVVGVMTPSDRAYLDQLVAAKTGVTSSEADKRVVDAFGDAQQAAETMHKAIAHALLWTFLALLIGAFCASFSATIGGRQRDHVVLL
jgi:hypothetical protein